MKTSPAFTLIELLIYLALFSVILGGVASAVYLMIQNSWRLQTQSALLEEGNFLLGKFAWAFSGASGAEVSQTPLMLSISKSNFAKNPLVFDVSGTELRLRQGGGLPENLNATAVLVNGLAFTNLPSQTGQPPGIDISFTLQALTSSGQSISQNFEITEYLW